jgi:hypothetical protein
VSPNTSSELHKFISAAKEHCASNESLVNILENAGWPKAEILSALGARYEALTGVLPNPFVRWGRGRLGSPNVI